MRTSILTAAALCFVAASVNAQSLSVADISAQIDQQLADLNPYAELLNDPDPARAMAALEIMLDSGDENLVHMALEFGLLSPNAQVQRTALEAFLSTRPVLTVSFDGSKVDRNNFSGRMSGNHKATVDVDSVAYMQANISGFDEENDCYTQTNASGCFLTVNSQGVFLSENGLRGVGNIGNDGVLRGSATVRFIDEAIPFAIQLLD